ncbi:MAG: DUF4290 domain-containing protein [Bacteroidales bacterium]|nr:DUF4290 domain-containing protein [Bacteroidales bacterium]
MDTTDNPGLEYNTERETLSMPEYGRNILKMVEQMKEIPDKEARTAQAKAIVKVMEILNPQVRQLDNYDHKLWDHLYMIAGYDLDIDAPYPSPVQEEFLTRPVPLPMKGEKIKATHYGRNIEKIIDLLAQEPDGEVKTEMIRSLATYMRQQYLIWNKDSVADETIFSDIEKLSEGRLRIPEGLKLHQVNYDNSFSRPGLSLGPGNGQNRNKYRKNKGRRK